LAEPSCSPLNLKQPHHDHGTKTSAPFVAGAVVPAAATETCFLQTSDTGCSADPVLEYEQPWAMAMTMN